MTLALPLLRKNEAMPQDDNIKMYETDTRMQQAYLQVPDAHRGKEH